jgi:hypothetical protein
MRISRLAFASLLSLLVALTGCNNGTSGGSDGGGGDGGGGGDAGPADGGGGNHDSGMACMAVAPMCVDQQIMTLDLFTTVSSRAVTEEGTVPGTFLTHIDSSAGGLTPTESYVYLRFSETGLAPVAISDQDAFASTDWDIAVRRFIIRLNSGVSGPSCVQAARTAPMTTFDSVTAVPAGLTFHSEVYMTDGTCDVVPDGSGLGSPSTVLSSYWTYPGCVSMTHNVYIVQLASGRHVKLEVLGYYDTAAQTQCDTMGTLPMPSTSGNIRLQWAFLD